MSNLVSSFEKKITVGFEESEKKIVDIPLDQIQPDPKQVRTIFDEDKLEELADSIKEHGVINPIHVRKAENKYIIVTGERRYRASKKAKLNTMPCIIYDNITEKEIKALMLIENLQREDLSCIETSKGMWALKETGLKQRQIANSLGISEGSVAKYLSIVDTKKIPKDWLETIEKKYNKASLSDLYKIACASKKAKPQLYKKLMEQADLEVEIPDVPEEKTKKDLAVNFDEELLSLAWEELIKEKRKNIQNICDYITAKKIQQLIDKAKGNN